MLRWLVPGSERFPSCLLSFPFSQFEQFIKFSLSNILLFEKESLLDESEQFVPTAWCRIYHIISQKFILNFVPSGDHRRLRCKDAYSVKEII